MEDHSPATPSDSLLSAVGVLPKRPRRPTVSRMWPLPSSPGSCALPGDVVCLLSREHALCRALLTGFFVVVCQEGDVVYLAPADCDLARPDTFTVRASVLPALGGWPCVYSHDLDGFITVTDPRVVW